MNTNKIATVRHSAQLGTGRGPELYRSPVAADPDMGIVSEHSAVTLGEAAATGAPHMVAPLYNDSTKEQRRGMHEKDEREYWAAISFPHAHGD
jgi:hypothetical protein